jgi:hypothetical protein
LITILALFSRHYAASSPDDKCTLAADRNAINRRNVQADVKKAYAANKKFFILEVKARIIAACIGILNNKKNIPCQHLLFEEPITTEIQKKNYIRSLAAAIVDKFVLDKSTSSDILNKILGEADKEDALRNQQVDANGRYICGFPGCSKTYK